MHRFFSLKPYNAILESYARLSENQLSDYFKIVFLRNPLERFLSAYQEVSMRYEMGEIQAEDRLFLNIRDSETRIHYFLESVERENWDDHLMTQSSFLSGVRVDKYYTVDNINQDMADLHERLNLQFDGSVPVYRSRNQRSSVHGYSKYLWKSEHLSPNTVDVIRRVYAEDFDLLESLGITIHA